MTADDPGEVIRWDVPHAESFPFGLVLYLPLVAMGAYLGLVGIAVLTLLPALLDRPTLVPFAVLFVLVGGPLSLLYLWPMLRHPEQRPHLPSSHWLRRIDRAPAVLALVAGAITLPVLGTLFGPTVPVALLYGLVFLGAPLLALLQATGAIDRAAGTLTVDRRTVDLRLIESFRRFDLGWIELLWLGYVEGTSWWGKPHLVAVPSAEADTICGELRRGRGSPPPTTASAPGTRDRDRLAQGVLVGTGLLCLALAAGLTLLEPDAAPYGTVVPGALGLLFLAGAYFLP